MNLEHTYLKPLTCAISSRALFDLDESHHIYLHQGVQAYQRHQIENEHEPLKPGAAFGLVKKLLSLNQDNNKFVEVILISRNSADTGLRIFNSIDHYALDISRAAFTSGAPTHRYLEAFHVDLFLSSHQEDVAQALKAGHAAATILPGKNYLHKDDILKIAFDGDSVIFSDDAETIFKQQGIQAFKSSEKEQANIPLPEGPFRAFLNTLVTLQRIPSNKKRIRTALITARSAPTHERVIKTLRQWDIDLDESLFLGGMDKGDFLKAFNADIFFDDFQLNCHSTSRHVPTGHVPHGIRNTEGEASSE